MAKLRIERAIKIVTVIEVDEEHYPSMSPQEARDSEYAAEMVDKLESFDEALQYVDWHEPLEYGEVGTTGEYSEVIVIVDEERPATDAEVKEWLG